MKKLLITTAILSGFLTSASAINWESDASTSSMIEEVVENTNKISASAGRAYDRASLSFSHTKVLDSNIKFGSHYDNQIELEIGFGYNSRVFAEAELRNKLTPFAYEDSYLNGLSVITFARAGAFSSTIKETRNVEKFDSQGNIIVNATEDVDIFKSYKKSVAGLGFGYRDSIFLTGTEFELKFAKGFGNDVNSETDFKVSTPLFTNFRNYSTNLEIGVRHTKTDFAKYDSASIRVEFKF